MAWSMQTSALAMPVVVSGHGVGKPAWTHPARAAGFRAADFRAAVATAAGAGAGARGCRHAAQRAVLWAVRRRRLQPDGAVCVLLAARHVAGALASTRQQLASCVASLPPVLTVAAASSASIAAVFREQCARRRARGASSSSIQNMVQQVCIGQEGVWRASMHPVAAAAAWAAVAWARGNEVRRRCRDGEPTATEGCARASLPQASGTSLVPLRPWLGRGTGTSAQGSSVSVTCNW